MFLADNIPLITGIILLVIALRSKPSEEKNEEADQEFAFLDEDFSPEHPEQDIVLSTSSTVITEETTDSTTKKKYMKKSTTLILCITITLVFSVAIGILLKYSKDARLDAAVSGYKIGYEEGSDEGYSNGYDEGYDNGESEGFTKGYEEGIAAPRSSDVQTFNQWVIEKSKIADVVEEAKRIVYHRLYFKNHEHLDTTTAATIVNEYINGGSPDNLKLAVQAIYEFYLYFIMEEY